MNEELPLTLFLYAESPLHVGSGSALGAVDLPIQRERSTGLPTLPGSGIRGALREQLLPQTDEKTKQRLEEWFGNEPPDRRREPKGANETKDKKKEEKFWAGALHLDDARLLLLPVRSLRHGWAWVTARAAIDRLGRDLDLADLQWKEGPPASSAWVAHPGAFVDEERGGKGVVLIEDIHLSGEVREEAKWLAQWIANTCLPDHSSYAPFRGRVPQQLVVLSDEDFKELCQTATEIVARVRMDATKHVVAKGALWTEELLPAESLLWAHGVVTGSRKPKDQGGGRKAAELRQDFVTAVQGRRHIRLGGDQGIGRGRVALSVLSVENGNG